MRNMAKLLPQLTRKEVVLAEFVFRTEELFDDAEPGIVWKTNPADIMFMDSAKLLICLGKAGYLERNDYWRIVYKTLLKKVKKYVESSLVPQSSQK